MQIDSAWWYVLGAIAVVVVVGLVFLAANRRAARKSAAQGSSRTRRFARRRPPREHFRPEGAPAPADAPLRRPAIIVNPTKFDDLDATRSRVSDGCRRLGWGEPIWIETTEQDPGYGQARHAVAEGATVVCALGGDGTVRAVASALVGTETPIGLLPGGTGNLLARNLNLPVDDLGEALRVALTGQNKRVDVGRLTLDASGEHERPSEHIFLIMAGLGFDAAMMADAPEQLKAKVGWLAYGVSGARNLRGGRFRVRMKVDDEPEVTRRVRTVVIGNCGKLTGGLVLLPEAELDDGWLDAVVLSPKGLAGWLAVAVRVMTRRRKGHERVDHRRGKELRIRADRPEEVQIDGDPIGKARALTVTVDPLALLVRVG